MCGWYGPPVVSINPGLGVQNCSSRHLWSKSNDGVFSILELCATIMVFIPMCIRTPHGDMYSTRSINVFTQTFEHVPNSTTKSSCIGACAIVRQVIVHARLCLYALCLCLEVMAPCIYVCALRMCGMVFVSASAQTYASYIWFVLAGPVSAPAREMAPAGTKTGLDLVPLARRVPKPRRTGDLDKDNSAELQYVGFQKLITLLTRRPDLILETLGRIECKINNAATADTGSGSDFFGKEVVSISRVPADWMASWCQQQAGAALDDGTMIKMLKAEPQTVERLATFSLQLPRSLALPQEARAKKVLARLLDERSKTLGCRLNRAWVKNVKGDGRIDWATGGCLCVVWGPSASDEYWQIHFWGGGGRCLMMFQ